MREHRTPSHSTPTLALTLALILAALALPVPSPAAAAEPPGLGFAQAFGAEASGRRPTDVAWIAGGERLSYVWKEEDGGEALWTLDPASGERRRLLRASDLPAGEIDSVHWSADGGAVVVESGGDLHLLRVPAAGPPAGPARLTETEAQEEDPAFSPDGGRVAFVRDGDLYLLDLTAPERVERRLTADGEPGTTLNGKTDWVYWEEIWGRDSTGFWWSPDGSRIAYYHFDETPVGTYPLVNFLPTYPEVEQQRYPKAGTANPRVKIGVLDLASGATTWMETHGEGDDVYLARVHWTPDGSGLAIQRLNREQTELDLLLCRPAEGSCSTLLEERWPTWINLGEEMTFLQDGRFVWASERTGWRHLYLYRADGTLLRPLTSGDGHHVTSLDAVNEGEGWLLYTAFAPEFLGGAGRRVYRAGLDGAPPVDLTPERGWHEVEAAAPAAGLWVREWSDADHPPRMTIHRADGGTVSGAAGGDLLPHREPPDYDPAALPAWEFLTIPGPEGSRLPARLLRPAAMEEGRRYPVIVYHYGGPGSQVVVDRWDTRHRDLWHKLMAERGFGVFMVDNQASIFFGKRGEDRVHRRFGEVNLAAQLAAVEYLETLPWVDGDRLGLWGWSGGGANTLYCLLNRPGVWRAGTAGAPVTDWHFYDTIWTERYLDHPEDNPEGYRDSSPITYAANLADALLIVHGTADDNVHMQNTLAMAHAFIAAGLPFEDAIHPRQKHGFKEPSLRHFFERMTEFFERHLAPRVP